MVRIVTRQVTKKQNTLKSIIIYKKGKGKQCILHNKVECPVFFM